MTSSSHIYTARNSERFMGAKHQAEAAKGLKYIRGASEIERASARAARVRMAAALRAAEHIKRRSLATLSGSPWQQACSRMLDVLLAVREAHNSETLFMRSDAATGFIDGAKAFGAINQQQWAALVVLRKNAYTIRLDELNPLLAQPAKEETHEAQDARTA